VTDAHDGYHSYIWNAAPQSNEYTRLTYGVMFHELALHFKAIAVGSELPRSRLYIGHDGSMIRLASGLGFGKSTANGPLRWPGLGSEIIFEVR
jgi:2-phosphoxylose phosphatase